MKQAKPEWLWHSPLKLTRALKATTTIDARAKPQEVLVKVLDEYLEVVTEGRKRKGEE
jgi:hypothetical protein